jgi:glycogen debranching enzyme
MRRNRSRGGRDALIQSGTGTLTLIDGLTFAISETGGDILPGYMGVVADDTRHLATLVARIDGRRLDVLGTSVAGPGRASFRGISQSRYGRLDAALEVQRVRTVRSGQVTDEITLSWWAPDPHVATVEMEFGTDFADIFEIRSEADGAGGEAPTVDVAWRYGACVLGDPVTGRSTEIHFDPAPSGREPGRAMWEAPVAHGRPWGLAVTVDCRGPDTAPGRREPASRPGRPLDAPAHAKSEPRDLGVACEVGLDDLDALSLPDRLDERRSLVAAGIPWFVALFGRDSLIASHQSRAFRPAQMLDTLLALAARQGREQHPDSGEEPGKILHEVRLTPRAWLGGGTERGARPYFGSVDATPLFLIVFAEAWRWGADEGVLRSMLPSVRAAVAWLREWGDSDGDGLVEYHGPGERSLRNQGWKDSDNGVLFADGTLARGPVAIVEAQGYAYRARRDIAEVLRAFGHAQEARELEREASLLRGIIRERYWLPGRNGGPGYFAMALDGDKRPVDAVASNMGHLLWCGVPTPDEAHQVAHHVMSPVLSSGWGLRTLAEDMAGYNPLSYHCGSVWPHDTAIACEGLRAYGLVDESAILAGGLLDAMRAFDMRLPELFGGHGRSATDPPVPYPTACRPQAWAAGVPLQLATLFAGLRADLPHGKVRVSPFIPEGLRCLTLEGIALSGWGHLSMRVGPGEAIEIIEAPDDLAIEVVGTSRDSEPAPGDVIP